MSHERFTPGPWVYAEWECDPRVNEDGNHYWGIKPEKFHTEAEYLEASGWMTEANARLLAAAPDLLEALQALQLQALQSNVSDPANEWGREALDMARAAIAKALGERQ